MRISDLTISGHQPATQPLRTCRDPARQCGGFGSVRRGLATTVRHVDGRGRIPNVVAVSTRGARLATPINGRLICNGDREHVARGLPRVLRLNDVDALVGRVHDTIHAIVASNEAAMQCAEVDVGQRSPTVVA